MKTTMIQIQKDLPPPIQWEDDSIWPQYGFKYQKTVKFTNPIGNKVWIHLKTNKRIKVVFYDHLNLKNSIVKRWEELGIVPVIANYSNKYIELFLEDFKFVDAAHWMQTIEDLPNSKQHKIKFFINYTIALKKLHEKGIVHGHPIFQNVQINPDTWQIILIDLKEMDWLKSCSIPDVDHHFATALISAHLNIDPYKDQIFQTKNWDELQTLLESIQTSLNTE